MSVTVCANPGCECPVPSLAVYCSVQCAREDHRGHIAEVELALNLLDKIMVRAANGAAASEHFAETHPADSVLAIRDHNRRARELFVRGHEFICDALEAMRAAESVEIESELLARINAATSIG